MKPKLHDGHLGRSQIAVIDDILAGLNEREAIKKNHVSPFRYRKWLKNPLFKQEFAERKESFERQGKFILINSLPHAARRLCDLINSEKDEIARKACMDIINLMKAEEDKAKAQQAECEERESHQPKISDEKAAKIWAIMAEPDEPAKSILQSPQPDGIPGILPPSYSNYSLPVQAAPSDIIEGAAICGIEYSALAEAFPDAIPDNYLAAFREVANSPGSNPVREKGLKSLIDAQLRVLRQTQDCRAGSSSVQADDRADILAGAAVCGISSSLLAVAFPQGIPNYFKERILQVAKSPGSNPDREQGLKNIVESEASIQRGNRFVRTY